jgi:hypothetical protein
VAGYVGYRLQNGFVLNAARSQLSLDHQQSLTLELTDTSTLMRTSLHGQLHHRPSGQADKHDAQENN